MRLVLVQCYFLFFCFFKQKTAYEMRISDWSSDVCSSDLVRIDEQAQFPLTQMRAIEHALKKAPYFATHAEALFGILGGGRSGLSDLNIALITWLAESFGIDSRFVRSTEIETGGAKADLLVSRSEEHTSELQSLMRISYAVFCLNKTK